MRVISGSHLVPVVGSIVPTWDIYGLALAKAFDCLIQDAHSRVAKELAYERP